MLVIIVVYDHVLSFKLFPKVTHPEWKAPFRTFQDMSVYLGAILWRISGHVLPSLYGLRTTLAAILVRGGFVITAHTHYFY